MDATGPENNRRELIGRAVLAGTAAALGAGGVRAWAQAPGAAASKPVGASATRPADTQPAKKQIEKNAVAPPAVKPSKYRGPNVNLKAPPAAGRYLLTDTREVIQNIIDQGGRRRANREKTTIFGPVTIHKPDASGNQEVRFVCARIAQLLTTGGRVRSFDSGGPPDRQDAAMSVFWRPIVGWQGRVRSAPGRRVEDSGDVDALLARVKPGPMLAEARRKLRRLAGSVLADLPLAAWARLVPPRPAAPGQAWRGEVYVRHQPVLGMVRMQCACRLQDVEQARGARAAVIDFLARGLVQARRVDAEVVAQRLKVEVRDMALRASGTVRLDLRTHLAVDVRSLLAGQGQLWLAEPNGPVAKLKIEFTSGRDITLAPAR